MCILSRPVIGTTSNLFPFPRKKAVVKAKPKEAWTWQKSLFAPAYEGAYEHPFEKDWELAHCDKLVNDDGSTKALMKANYGEFLSVYKLFCSNNKAIFTLGWNDFTDFTVSADLEVKRKADADMVFFGCCTTGPKNPHLEPEEVLVSLPVPRCLYEIGDDQVVSDEGSGYTARGCSKVS